MDHLKAEHKLKIEDYTTEKTVHTSRRRSKSSRHLLDTTLMWIYSGLGSNHLIISKQTREASQSHCQCTTTAPFRSSLVKLQEEAAVIGLPVFFPLVAAAPLSGLTTRLAMTSHPRPSISDPVRLMTVAAWQLIVSPMNPSQRQLRCPRLTAASVRRRKTMKSTDLTDGIRHSLKYF